MFLTELEFTESGKVEIIWKNDPEWQSKIETVFDFATVKVTWQYWTTEIVDLKDLLLNADLFMEKTVHWEEDFTCAGRLPE